MEISDAQERMRDFCRARDWDRFRASLVYVHLMEELTEIGEEILYEEGYKREGIGHERSNKDVGREFAQSFALFLQLSLHYGVDLEGAFERELGIMEDRFPADKWKVRD
ncbi:MAG TPA: MazG-like family protein [Candidatus Methanofastidiosa archaeon]|nr:MazG-like family protein [Candidatus Methanofastidiosa archaeon]